MTKAILGLLLLVVVTAAILGGSIIWAVAKAIFISLFPWSLIAIIVIVAIAIYKWEN